jgi:hypothetical protein
MEVFMTSQTGTPRTNDVSGDGLLRHCADLAAHARVDLVGPPGEATFSRIRSALDEICERGTRGLIAAQPTLVTLCAAALEDLRTPLAGAHRPVDLARLECALDTLRSLDAMAPTKAAREAARSAVA